MAVFMEASRCCGIAFRTPPREFTDCAHGKTGEVTAAPILDAPDFEHLEAKGQPFLRMQPEIKVIRLRTPGRLRRRQGGRDK